MSLVPLNCTVIRVDACELDGFAKIVATILAKEAFAAWDAGLDSDAITYSTALDVEQLPVLLGTLPGFRFFTPSPHCRTTPAAS